MSDTPTSPHRVLEKNGREQIQDRDVQRLLAWKTENEKALDAILAKLDKYLFGGRIVWGGIVLFFILTVGLIGWMALEISTHRTDQRGMDRTLIAVERELVRIREDLISLRMMVEADRSRQLERERK